MCSGLLLIVANLGFENVQSLAWILNMRSSENLPMVRCLLEGVWT